MVAILFCASAGTASAAGPNAIVDQPGCTASTLPANDDNSTAAVAIGFTASFFGKPYTTLFVNNNGSVTFDSALGVYTPLDFSTSSNVIIAPFLADVDTSVSGSGAVTYGQTTFEGQPAFCVDWSGVGYFSGHTDKLNSFQLLLVKRGDTGAFDIVFNYDQVQWETGDDSSVGATIVTNDENGGIGGTPASWGFANGDGEDAHYFVGPGSFTHGALLDGGPSALIAGSRGGTTPHLGRYIFAVSAAGPTGPTLSGEVTAGIDPVAYTPVQICPTGGGTCLSRTTNSAGYYQAAGLSGSYDLTAFPPAGSNRTPGYATAVISTVDVSQDIPLGSGPGGPPPGTTITHIGTNPDGIPVVYWNAPLTLTTEGCTGGTASYELRAGADHTLVRHGPMDEGPAGTYIAGIAPLFPNHGDAVVHIAITCPNSSDDKSFDFGIYIDPSGLVRNSLGAPVSGATVVLLRSGTPGGTFTPVPDGSALMSPSNRTNPDHTTADGRFGWDVVAGYYKVRASKSGCVSNAVRTSAFAESAVLTIPPATIDLDLRLYCGEASGGGGGGGGGGSADTTAPSLTGLKLSPSTFRVSSAKTAVAAAAKKVASGTKIRFKLSEAASVVFTIERKTTGRRAGSSCKKQTKDNRKHKKCTRYVAAGTLRRSNVAKGSDSVSFGGRIGSRKLRIAGYRLLARPTDAAGNKGKQRKATFKIVHR